MEMTRAQHMQWAKSRALRYVDEGQGVWAIASMLSDLRKHPETEAGLMGCTLAAIVLDDKDLVAVRKWIDGCN